MDTLTAFKLNFQTIYRNQENARGIAITMIDFGYKQFKTTFKSQNLEKLKNICEKGFYAPSDNELILDFVFNELTDSIKLSICFENIMKAILLSNLYVIHAIDSNIPELKPLASKQRKEPIQVKELLNISPWQHNNNIDCIDESVKQQIRGLKEQTINYSTMIGNTAYLNHFNFPSTIIELLQSENLQRNRLHLYNYASFQARKSTYENFKIISEFIEVNTKNWVTQLHDSLDIAHEDRKLTMIIKAQKRL